MISYALHRIGAAFDAYNGVITAIATAFIAWFTLSLRQATDRLWTAGEKQLGLSKEISDRQSVEIQHQIDIAREANRAAQTSADAAVAAERARFFIVIHDFNISDLLYLFAGETDLVLRNVSRSTPPEITYRIRNYGKTPGILSEVSLGMGISPYPVDPVYSLILSSFAEHMIGGGDATSTKEFSYDSPLESSQADEIGRNISRLWFYGRIDYEDVFGNPQVHRFYFRTVMSERRCILQPYDHKHYNQST